MSAILNFCRNIERITFPEMYNRSYFKKDLASLDGNLSGFVSGTSGFFILLFWMSNEFHQCYTKQKLISDSTNEIITNTSLVSRFKEWALFLISAHPVEIDSLLWRHKRKINVLSFGQWKCIFFAKKRSTAEWYQN